MLCSSRNIIYCHYLQPGIFDLRKGIAWTLVHHHFMPKTIAKTKWKIEHSNNKTRNVLSLLSLQINRYRSYSPVTHKAIKLKENRFMRIESHDRAKQNSTREEKNSLEDEQDFKSFAYLFLLCCKDTFYAFRSFRRAKSQSKRRPFLLA